MILQYLIINHPAIGDFYQLIYPCWHFFSLKKLKIDRQFWEKIQVHDFAFFKILAVNIAIINKITKITMTKSYG